MDITIQGEPAHVKRYLASFEHFSYAELYSTVIFSGSEGKSVCPLGRLRMAAQQVQEQARAHAQLLHNLYANGGARTGCIELGNCTEPGSIVLSLTDGDSE